MTTLPQDLQPIKWDAIEDAIYGWLTGAVASLGAIVPEVIFEDQNVPQPNYPYASVKMLAYEKEGGADEIITGYVLGAPTGKEITMLSRNLIVMSYSIQFYADAAAGGNASQTRARSIASKASASLGMADVQDFLSTGGLAIVSVDGILDTSAVINGEWTSRATLDVRLRTTAQMVQTTGYIASVEVKSTDLGLDFIVGP